MDQRPATPAERVSVVDLPVVPCDPSRSDDIVGALDGPSQAETEKGWADLKTFQTRKAAKTDAKSPQSDRDQARRSSCVDLSRMAHWLQSFFRFIGPGFLVSVSFVDAGNFNVGISAGAQFRFALLTIILLSNILAIFLQYLALRLGTVTGRDLAQSCRTHLPLWLNLLVYLFAEAAILATDIAEAVGSAIALNLLSKGRLPLPAGVAITLIDVVVILFFYQRDGTQGVTKTQIFEAGIAVLVIALATCLSMELAKITGVTVGEVLKGYIPSATIFRGSALYVSCGIIGATVMPHSLFLGSGVVQTRVKDYDIKHGIYTPASALARSASLSSPQTLTALELEKAEESYRPSLQAIRHCLPYSTIELVLALISIAFYVNSALLILAGATLSDSPEAANADLFSIYDLLKEQLSPAAATIYAVGLFFSGESAGLVVTLAGQMIMEGHLRWNIVPWKRRLITRCISIVPCIVIASAVGRRGLSAVLTASQVALSIILPFVTAPLVYFTCRKHIMSVEVHHPSGPPSTAPLAPPLEQNNNNQGENSDRGNAEEGRTLLAQSVDLSNGWFVAFLSVVVWLFIAALNLFLVIALAIGKAG
ncbi:natural resistance-associated macrophage protein-domain-containing protein [Cantharellus anzutake]|uniref:natural resistance-associated macrophage protein-domain-containing protein n=1 Tax=Cantharellus anzutake TaxID=1750568 RepID=UPI0019061D94|nr:natural resistance-associated macrophage protein-domain-containing protein [Cantharellus anzutake]KAF8338733.1 natural resistance-associated macrophage protein-domain-containing protein [Cantharellus anzutake]